MIVDPEEIEFLRRNLDALAAMPESARREMEIILGTAERPAGWEQAMVMLCGPLPVTAERENVAGAT